MSPVRRFALATTAFLALGLGGLWFALDQGSISAPPYKQRLSQKQPSSARSDSSAPSADSSAESVLGSSSVAGSSPSLAGQKFSGPKVTVDPMASWSETPAWPEGPQLFAVVETASTRYINLRPNDIGLLPQLNVVPGEAIKVTLTLPEAEAGDTL